MSPYFLFKEVGKHSDFQFICTLHLKSRLSTGGLGKQYQTNKKYFPNKKESARNSVYKHEHIAYIKVAKSHTSAI